MTETQDRLEERLTKDVIVLRQYVNLAGRGRDEQTANAALDRIDNALRQSQDIEERYQLAVARIVQMERQSQDIEAAALDVERLARAMEAFYGKTIGSMAIAADGLASHYAALAPRAEEAPRG